jgi:Xaa-Pro aminopeptidase
MGRDGLDAIIATMPENITYASDYLGINPYIYRELELYAVIPADQRIDPALIVPIDVLDVLAQQPTWIKDVRIFGTYHVYGSHEAELTQYERVLLEMRGSLPHYASAQDALVSALEDKQLADKRLGLDELTIPLTRQEAIRGRLSRAVIDPGAELFREIRAVKTPDHVGMMQQAATILENAMEHGIEAIQGGGTELDIRKACWAEIARQGALPSHWEASAGTRSGACFPPSDYRLAKGDLLRYDIGCRYNWSFADTGRTAVVGESTDEQRRLFDALLAGQKAALELVGPGASPSEIFEADVTAVRKAGIKDYRRHHVGHGIGLEMYEAPIIAPSAKSDIHRLGREEMVLEPGMVINIETPYYHLGVGGFQIEDTVVVTEDGYEYFTHAPRGIRSIQI